MKSLKTLFKTILFLCVILATIVKPEIIRAQFPNSSLTNYYEIVGMNHRYYDSLIQIYGTNLKGTGYTQFLRYKNAWQGMVPPNGDMLELYTRMQSTRDKLNSLITVTNNVAYSSDWYQIGPNYGNGSDKGRLMTLAIDPDNENIILTAAANGGLFYSADGGNLFQNAGTDQFVSPSGQAHESS
ncbi:MAG TPA: hypothetical protein PLP88_05965, partial [Bacteroidales bacterium]|nr:hypothetical protein [Bacteroidales bacterium]